MSLPSDLWVRHLLGQQSKAFFGYGPKGKAAVAMQGRVVAFTSELAGPGMVAALATEPFGRLCMRYINHRYVEQGRAELERWAAGAGVRLVAVGSDLDFDAAMSVGVGVAEQALPGAVPERSAPELARQLGAIEAAVGPAMVTARLPGALPEPDPAGAWLAVWAERSAAVGRALRQAVDRTATATFLVPAGDHCLAGMILKG